MNRPGERFVNLSATATVLSPEPSSVVAFDRAGRLITFARGESFFRRSLGSDLFERHRTAETRWRRLGEPEAVQRFAEARELALAMASEPGEVALRERVEREVAPWTPERLLAERERFDRTYRPIAILPPDQYLSVVVQATEGCTWNRCTFCSFYQDRPFRARGMAELGAHLAAVRELLGGDLARRRSVFLADGNALALGTRRLLPIFDRIARELPGLPVASFVDVWSGEKHDPADWHALVARGLTQVAIGMESGDDELLALVDKPGSVRELASFVAELKAAGVALSLIVIAGLGGERFRVRHREATVAALTALPLDRRDLVYLSPFVEDPTSEYARRAAASGLQGMTPEAIADELATLAVALRAAGLRVGRYDLREFFY